MKQATFASLAFEHKKKRMRRHRQGRRPHSTSRAPALERTGRSRRPGLLQCRGQSLLEETGHALATAEARERGTSAHRHREGAQQEVVLGAGVRRTPLPRHQSVVGFVKVRYQGLAKNTARVFALIALANLYRVRHRLLLQRA